MARPAKGHERDSEKQIKGHEREGEQTSKGHAKDGETKVYRDLERQAKKASGEKRSKARSERRHGGKAKGYTRGLGYQARMQCFSGKLEATPAPALSPARAWV